MDVTKRLTRSELFALLDNTEQRILAIAGRWHDHVPAVVRMELHGIAGPLIEAQIAEGTRRKRNRRRAAKGT